MNAARWFVVLIALFLILGLGAYARGPEHHRGDDVGTHGTPPAQSQ